MEIMISLSQGDESRDEMVARRSAIIKWLLPYPVSKRVHAKGCLLDKACSNDACINESSPPVAPA